MDVHLSTAGDLADDVITEVKNGTGDVPEPAGSQIWEYRDGEVTMEVFQAHLVVTGNGGQARFEPACSAEAVAAYVQALLL